MQPAQTIAPALIAFGVTEFVLRRGGTARNLTASAGDRGTTLLILTTYAVVTAGLMLGPAAGPAFPPAVAWGGAGAAYAGLGLRWTAMVALGRFYTRTLVTVGDQRVVQSGPYRYVRHPGYLGSLMTWGGAAAATANVAMTLLVLALLLGVYARRIAVEERMLLGRLGADYARYRSRSWRLIPGVF